MLGKQGSKRTTEVQVYRISTLDSSLLAKLIQAIPMSFTLQDPSFLSRSTHRRLVFGKSLTPVPDIGPVVCENHAYSLHHLCPAFGLSLKWEGLRIPEGSHGPGDDTVWSQRQSTREIYLPRPGSFPGERQVLPDFSANDFHTVVNTKTQLLNEGSLWIN